MENLWPVEILFELDQQIDGEIERVLVAQAEGIGQRTLGLVAGFVQDRSVLPARAWSLELYSAHQPGKTTPIFIVRTEAGKFPAVIESFDPDQTERHKRVEDLSSFQEVLRHLLHAPQTKSIVQVLADEATNAGVKVNARAKLQAPSLERTLLVGGVTKNDLNDFCHVVLLDVAGFIDANLVRKFLTVPDEPGSLISQMNGRFVVTVKFLDCVKFTLSREELLTLQAEAKNALGNHAHLSLPNSTDAQ